MGLEILAKEAFENCVVDFAINGFEILKKVSEKKYDLLFTDMNMPNTNIFDLLHQITELRPDLKILVISINPEDAFAKRISDSGALGFISKSALDAELKDAMLQVASGNKYYPKQVSRQSLEPNDRKPTSNPFNTLSTREFEVALLLLKGNGALEISNKLSINASTASSYKARVFQKLKITSVIELDRLARLNQVITDDSMLH